MLNDLYTFLERVSWQALLVFAIVLLVVGIIGNVRGWWYSKAAVEKLDAVRNEEVAGLQLQVEDLKRSRDMWQQLTFEGFQSTKKAADNQALIAAAIQAAVGTKGESSHG